MKRKAVYAVIAAAVPSTFLIAATVGATAVVGYSLDVANMPLVRTIDERYMSFQIGMSHLTGGET
ncbi:MAG: hypothetical protein IPG06_18315 [Haliea sp.]|nr:hypothetical protein [Haliea sp.]